jgi:hypothetical protein
MRRNPVTADQLEVLRDVLSKHLPKEARRLLSDTDLPWSRSEKQMVREALGKDLAVKGFDANYEPTPYGRVLESLIDLVNRLPDS